MESVKSGSSGWCILAKINGWVGVVASAVLTVVVYKIMKDQQKQDMSKMILFAGIGITAVFGISLYLLYLFPDYCRIIGIMNAVLYIGLMFIYASKDYKVEINPSHPVPPPNVQ